MVVRKEMATSTRWSETGKGSPLAKEKRVGHHSLQVAHRIHHQCVGIPKKTVVYYSAHAITDIGHVEAWLSHVIEPQVQSAPAERIGIAEGFIVRADATLDCFDHCMAHARTLAA